MAGALLQWLMVGMADKGLAGIAFTQDFLKSECVWSPALIRAVSCKSGVVIC